MSSMRRWDAAFAATVLLVIALFLVLRAPTGPLPSINRETAGATTLRRICDGGPGFGGAPRYQGAAPHPLVVLDQSTVAWFGGAATARVYRDPAPINEMQLVGCLTPRGPASSTAIRTCRFREGVTMTLYRGEHRLNVYTVASARLVRTLTVEGSSDASCPLVTVIPPGATETSDNTPPGDRDYNAAVNHLITGPADAHPGTFP
jgi:hypothetical protein